MTRPDWVYGPDGALAQRRQAPYQDSTLFHTPWPQDTVARYATVGGATVDVTQRPRYVDDPELLDAIATCLGCDTQTRFAGEHEPAWGDGGVLRANTDDAKTWAQEHAEKCRALPRPQAGA